MKIIIMSYLCLLMACTVAAQKHDAVWLVGLDSVTAPTENGKITFTDTAVVLDSIYRHMSILTTNCAISDTAGNLLFYTNGIDVNNKYRTYVGAINASALATSYIIPRTVPSYCGKTIGLNTSQSAMIIPNVLYDSLYYIIYLRVDEFLADGNPLITLMYSVYDTRANNGNGLLREKDVVLVQDSANLAGGLTAAKHANGRDWWILQPTREANNEGAYQTLLLDSNGIRFQYKQKIGHRNHQAYSRYGQAVFSPNASIYASATVADGLQLFDFNRCNGRLSNWEYIPIPNDSVIYYGANIGAAISANSRFLYVGAYDKLYQYDLQAVDRGASRETVATNNRCVGQYWQNVFSSCFSIMELAPNGKIYGSMLANDVMHVIDSPNYKGAACQVSPCGFYTRYNNNHNNFNFPHYRTPAIPESDCWLPPNPEPNEGGDIISGTSKTTDKEAIKLYPNPARTVIYLQSDLAIGENTKIFIYNQLGQLLKTVIVENASTLLKINVADLPNGAYTVRIDSKPTTVSMQFSIDR